MEKPEEHNNNNNSNNSDNLKKNNEDEIVFKEQDYKNTPFIRKNTISRKNNFRRRKS